MTDIKRPINIHQGYHAHVYFEDETLAFATDLCAQAGQRFSIGVGRVHQKLVGPHPKWSCQLTFNHQQFDDIIPWLDQSRDGLSILVHGVTGNDLKDHTDHAYWLGDSLDLDLSML